MHKQLQKTAAIAAVLLTGISVATLRADNTVLNWFLRNNSATRNITGVAFLNNKYIAVGSGSYQSGNNVHLQSPDGKTWTAAAQFTSDDTLKGIAAGNGKFVAVARTQAWHSADGTTWQSTSLPGVSIQNVRFVNGRFFIFAGRMALHSPDGVNWEAWTVVQENEYSKGFYDIAYDGNAYLIVGYNSNSGNVFITQSTNNGATWAEVPYTLANRLQSVAYGNGRFVAVGGIEYPHGLIMTSTDGVNWTHSTNICEYILNRIIFADGRFVAVADAGTILVSANGADWITQDSGTGSSIKDICHAQGQFLGVGGGFGAGLIVQSGPSVPGPTVGPAIYANGERGTVNIEHGEIVTLSVTMNAGGYAGTAADWWVIAVPNAGAQWFYLDSGMRWRDFPAGNLPACAPAHTGALMNITDPVTVLPAYELTAGTYQVYFAVTQAGSVLDPAGQMLSDVVTVVAQ